MNEEPRFNIEPAMTELKRIYRDFAPGSLSFAHQVFTHCGYGMTIERIRELGARAKTAEEFHRLWDRGVTNRLDNVEIVLDRTDWSAFAQQKRILQQFATILSKETVSPRVKYPEYAARQNKLIEEFVHWLEALELAAEMDGYRTEDQRK